MDSVRCSLYSYFTSVFYTPSRNKKQNKLRDYILHKNDKLCIYLLNRNIKLDSNNFHLLLNEFRSYLQSDLHFMLLSFNEYKGIYKIAKYICENKDSHQRISEYYIDKMKKYLMYYEEIRDYIKIINSVLQLSIFKDLDCNTSKILFDKFMSQIPVPKNLPYYYE
ncbi:MAG: hypothetical protein EBU66_13520 [Bacteroidetes bacterium]|nr:hypothetical protein [Bacteroidota bacterium]